MTAQQEVRLLRVSGFKIVAAYNPAGLTLQNRRAFHPELSAAPSKISRFEDSTE